MAPMKVNAMAALAGHPKRSRAILKRNPIEVPLSAVLKTLLVLYHSINWIKTGSPLLS